MNKAVEAPALPRAVIDLLQAQPEPAILLNRVYAVLAANTAYEQRYADAAPLLQRRCYEVSHHYAVPCDQAGETCPMQACLRSASVQRTLHLHHTPRGEEHVDVEMFPIHDEGGEIRYFLEVMHQTRVASALPQGPGLVGRSALFNRMVELVQRVAPSETAVLLLGGTGTGKELVARALHESSRRRDGPFVPVECSGLAETLFESELFGHEKGAFTGAQTRKTGLVEAARGGTLFLDELGDVPLAMQVKLLRLLETGAYRRVGSVQSQRADFRLVCATHRDLRDMVRHGLFREDLYYRISPFPIALPPLRERIDDLPLLIDALLQRMPGAHKLRVDPQTIDCLAGYDFPGNVRELRNILERASVLTDDGVIRPEHLPEDIRCAPGGGRLPAPGEIIPLDEMERRYLRQVVARFTGDKRDLARALGLSDRTLYRKLKSLTAK